MRVALFLILLPLSAGAEGREAFYGTWGTEQQCAGAPIKPGGTVLAQPFEIDRDWLRQGRLWCRLDWFPVEHRIGGFFTGAYAQCGEDSVQTYLVGMKLRDDNLQLRWNVFTSNGPLKRCARFRGD